jgi:hypothetical protein
MRTQFRVPAIQQPGDNVASSRRRSTTSDSQANVWIAIFSYIGNYFWTHYFYTLLGASYTFKSFRLNNVSARRVPYLPACLSL